MTTHTVITTAPAHQGGGVSLAKAGDPVSAPRVPVSPTAMVNIGHTAWWGVPASQVRVWITGRLRDGEYAEAAWLSDRLHGA